MGVFTPLWFGAWDSYLMAIKVLNFKRYLRCTKLENLFKNCIFVISVKNSTLQLNFKAQLLLIKIHLINAKSQIQPTWHHLLPEKFSKYETLNNFFQDSACAFMKSNYAVMFLATWCIYWHQGFSKFCNFSFGAKSR